MTDPRKPFWRRFTTWVRISALFLILLSVLLPLLGVLPLWCTLFAFVVALVATWLVIRLERLDLDEEKYKRWRQEGG